MANLTSSAPPGSGIVFFLLLLLLLLLLRRKRILNIIAEIDTESQLARLRQLAVQGRWLEWTDAMHSDLSWRRLIHGLDDGELQFNLRAISNTLPTPDNLRRWGQNEVDPACPLCGRPATPSPHPELLQCSASSRPLYLAT